MKLLASLVSVSIAVLLVVYFITRDPAGSAPGDEANTKSSSRLPANNKPIKNTYIDAKWKYSLAETEGERSFMEADTAEAKLMVLDKLQSSDPDSLAPVLRRALADPNEKLRIQAVLMTPSLYSLPEDVTDILSAASYDESQEVRNYALEMTQEQAPGTKLGVYAATITSPFPEIRESTVLELGRVRTEASLLLLMKGLENKDPAFVAKVNDELSNMVDKRFDSIEEANQWWSSNSEKFDDRLIRMVD